MTGTWFTSLAPSPLFVQGTASRPCLLAKFRASGHNVQVLCDPRVAGKGHGKLCPASVPPMPRTRELAGVRAFFDDATTTQSSRD